jgi:hypothetical protein
MGKRAGALRAGKRSPQLAEFLPAVRTSAPEAPLRALLSRTYSAA